MLLLLVFATSALRAESSPERRNAEGVELYRQARYREAEAEFRRAFLEWDRAKPEFAGGRAIVGVNLGTVLWVEGRYAEGETLLTESCRELEGRVGAESLESARCANALAALYQAWGKPAEAEAPARLATRVFAKRPDATESDRANALVLLAAVYMDLKRFGDAESILNRLRDLPESALELRVYNDLAVAAIRMNDLPAAEALIRRALEMAPRVVPESHPLRAAALTNLAQICRFQKRYVEAEQNYRDAIAIWTETLGARHPQTARGMMNLAALYHERGREAGAEDLYWRAAGIFRDALGEDHEMTLLARAELADVLRAEGRYSEARRLSAATIPALESRLGPADARVVRVLQNYQRLLKQAAR